MRQYTIHEKLMFSYCVITAGVLFLLGLILIPERIRTDDINRTEYVSVIAQILCEDPEVKQAIKEGKAEQNLVERMDALVSDSGVDFIVLAQADGRRVYHPNHEKIGFLFEGGDETEILQGKPPYMTTRKGHSSVQRRFFSAVKEENQVIGFVMVSTALDTIRRKQAKMLLQLWVVFILALLAGIVAAKKISEGMRSSLLGYEPEEFANIYRQGEQALRASTHEFLNKMHVVSGLLQIGEVDEAVSFIGGITEELQDGQSRIVQNIKNPTISALLLGKTSRAKELDIQFSLRKDSCLQRHTPYLYSSDLITIIGNLVENAFDAVKDNESKAPKQVEIFIGESQEGLTITVDDTGCGMTEEQIKAVKEGSFTTKGSGHGTGLRLIHEVVNRQNGYLEIESEPGVGSSFTVSFDKERGERSC